jgi:ubiquinone/menaquinone biosynthesis C-methylase UbiE/intracellular sulfur oxidation DsrE/DsrF family protein
MTRWLGLSVWLACGVACLLGGVEETRLAAQEKSVRPGINDTFRDPDVRDFIGKFEIESREVFAKRRQILEACGLRPGQTVGDIGAGTGLYTRLFASAVGDDGRVLAVDIAQKFLDHIDQRCREAGLRNVETVRCETDSTGLADASLDFAFICDTYHHFEFPRKTMQSLWRALKPGGRVVVIDFKKVAGESSDWVMSHVRAGQPEVEAEIRSVGFRKAGEVPNLLKENYLVVFEKPAPVELAFPLVKQFGGIRVRPGAVDPPRAGAKVVLDVTQGGKPTELNKGLERAARLLNIYGAAGLTADDVRVAVVLHGEATFSVLTDEAYRARFGTEGNPNRALLAALREVGVEVLVCGQALHNKGVADEEVAAGIPVAVSALTAVLNRQAAGYGCLTIP